MGNSTFSCADCGVLKCEGKPGEYPDFCLTANMEERLLEEALELYVEEENHLVMVSAANVEAEFYGKMTRVEETMEFARRIGARRLGIATCVGLIRETRTLTKILRNHGFEVVAVACKVGAVRKSEAGIDPSCEAVGRNMCNPILQAKILNEKKTDLNIVMGLCVGRDSLFIKYSQAWVTTLVAKDRVLGHNPAAALYTANSYYDRLLSSEEAEGKTIPSEDV